MKQHKRVGVVLLLVVALLAATVLAACEKTCTVSFVDHDGTALQTVTVAEGGAVAYSAGDPTREADAQYTYVFVGWEDEDGMVWPTAALPAATKNATYTAKYNTTLNSYSVTFVNGTQELEGKTLSYGASPTYTGETPTKEATAEHEYEFVGWSTDADATEGTMTLAPVSGEVTYYAVFRADAVKYNVTWNVEGVTTTERFAYGTNPVYGGTTPKKQATLEFTYTFAGWATDKSATEGAMTPPAVTGEVTYYAVFSKTTNTYKVEFVDGDGNVVQDTEFAYGTSPVYNGTTPTKTTDVQYHYTFNGWLVDGATYGDGDALPVVMGEARYEASFVSTLNTYEIVWMVDGVESKTQVEYGKVPVFDGTPSRAPTADWEYDFLGWATTSGASEALGTLPTVSGTATYYAVFDQVVRTYDVRFVVDGKEIAKEDNALGTTPVFSGDEPVKLADAKYTYTFAGWSRTEGGDLVTLGNETIEGDTTFYAVFDKTVNKYLVTFLSESGAELQKSEVEYDAVPVYSGAEQTKDKTAQYTYVFAGWSDGTTTHAVLPAVTGAVTYKATFSATVNRYTVTVNYEVEGGEVSAPATKTFTADYGTAYGETETTTPALSGYLPDRYWIGGVLTADRTVTVTYHKASVWDGTYPATAGYTLSGDGSETNPYLIQSAADLAYLSAVTRGVSYGNGEYYKLTTSIDLADHEFYPICFSSLSGSSYSYHTFKAHIDGDGHTIAGLSWTDGTLRGVGLVEKMIGSISDLTIEGSLTALDRAGGFVYWMEDATSEIRNCISYVDVTTVSGQYAGGIIGTGVTKLTDCENYGNITGATFYNGGIAGASSGVITRCYNYGTVKGGTYNDGGIAGHSSGGVSDSVNYGAVSGTSAAAGIVGLTDAVISITGCTNYGTITANHRVAGILGYASTNDKAVTITSCVNYGTVNGAGTNNSSVAEDADGKLTHKSKDNNVGGIAGYIATGSLNGVTNHGAVFGNGRAVGGILGWQSGSDVTVDHATNHGDVTVTGWGDKTGGITGYTSGAISNSTNYGAVAGIGLVGGIAGDINAITVSNCVNYGAVSSSKLLISDQKVGGIVGTGYETGMLITGCTNYGTVTATNEDSKQTGGIVGWTTQTVEDCFNYGVVTGHHSTGGIAGWLSGKYANIKRSTNHATVTGTIQVGGIAGYGSGYVTASINHGDVFGTGSGDGAVAGIMGWASGTTAPITDCVNHGDVTGAAQRVGGIAGYSSGNITGCTNNGNITGGGRTGGIVGEHNDSNNANGLIVDDCDNTGAVLGTYHVGGIIGVSTSIDVTACTNSGAVGVNGDLSESNESYGGIVGHATYFTTVARCHNTGAISGFTAVGGIAGYMGADVIFDEEDASAEEPSTSTGEVTGETKVGELVGNRKTA